MNVEEIWKNASRVRQSDYLSGAGRMADAILALDWSQTSIGALETWPTALRSVVQMATLTRQPICLFWGADLNIIYNDAYAPFLGEREPNALGQPFEILWADIWSDVAPIVAEALSGKGTWAENLPLTMTRNGFEEETYWSFSYSPLHDDDGRVAGLINIATETTQAVLAQRSLNDEYAEAQRLLVEKEQAERQQRVLQREMAHRIKNTLSMVMAIVSQTMRHADTMEEASVTIGARIAALSRAQDLLRQSTYQSAPIREVVAGALKAHIERPDRVEIRGADLDLPSQAALGLSLALHELATNATKYGALSNDEGHIVVTWRCDRDGEFRFEWREAGGPSAVSPKRRGFGSRLINNIVPSYFEGTGVTTYEPSGLHYVLEGTVPLEPA